MPYLKPEDLSTATDEQILDAYDNARGSMSYYNAAEGNWSSETDERNKAYHYLNEVGTELQRRNLTGRPGNYLC